jgi:hypothetical protein
MRESKTQIIGKMIRAEQDELSALFKKEIIEESLLLLVSCLREDHPGVTH